MTVSYFVLNENTLGYIDDQTPTIFGVLAGKPQLGGHDWQNGPLSVPIDYPAARPATLVDFEYYRVCANGHLS